MRTLSAEIGKTRSSFPGESRAWKPDLLSGKNGELMYKDWNCEHQSILHGVYDHLSISNLLGKPRDQILTRLREEIRSWERRWRVTRQDRPISTGYPQLDTFLPHHGWCWGTLVEWLTSGEGGGAKTIALATLARLLREGGVLVVVDPTRQFYPPAVLGFGIPLDSVVLVHPPNEVEVFWAVGQILAGGEGIVVWADLPRCKPAVYRRLQLAAEQSGALGFFFRSSEVRREPVWVDIRLVVRSLPGRNGEEERKFRVELLRARGICIPDKRVIDVLWDTTTHSLRVLSPVVPTATPCGVSAGA
jgi:protein ImuA